jgi:uncharacterized protein (DUF1684 family)
MRLKYIAKKFFGFRALSGVFLVIALSGCSKPQTGNRATPGPEDLILQERRAKDEAFRSDKNSPILEKDRSAFEGLAYYPVNPNLRFSTELHRYPGPKQVRLSTNTGEIRRGLRYGYFSFQAGGQICRLQVYRLEDAPESGASLFIPFRDSTSGQETYAAGRYIDLKENTSGIYDLDFNRAYNPYCAYNNEFSCPIPPAENTLGVPIQAGEKKYSSGPAH